MLLFALLFSWTKISNGYPEKEYPINNILNHFDGARYKWA